MRISSRISLFLGTSILLVSLVACDEKITAPSTTLKCDTDNGGITLPAGFCAVVVADLNLDGRAAEARHMAVTPNGDLFVAINSPLNRNPSFGIVGLRDVDGDGHADEESRFSANLGGSGIAWGDGFLYFGANDRVLRFNLPSGQLTPTGASDVLVTGLPNTGNHISKTLVLAKPTVFVNIGSATNSCQVNDRQMFSPGIAPCPELAGRAGVWGFDITGTNQTLSTGVRYATGYRNLVALAMNGNTLYAVQHGRDLLDENWPNLYTVNQGAILPAEELVRVPFQSNNGWPYCYYDAISGKKVLAPEYGGDGQRVSNATTPVNCDSVNQPLAAFGAHWAPNGMLFYTGDQFPTRYRGGAFIAFHGGFDRAPLPNEGYKVMFVPFSANGTVSGPSEIFADGFAGSTGPLPATAVHQPVGVTQGPDGSLYISDDKGGRIWRVIYRG